MSFEVFATKIPLEASFIDIIRALEPLAKIKHITLIKKKEDPEKGDKQTQSAFLEYYTEEDAAKVLEYGNSDHHGKLVSEQMLSDKIVRICDEPILILPFKERQEILDRMEKQDKRNLHLMWEGHIKPGDAAAEGVSDADMAKSKRLFETKQKKLADTNYSIVPTRLCVMNVPDGINAGRVRKIFAVASQRYSRNHKDDPMCRKAMKSPVRITEVRKIEDQKGLFFVEFSQHEHALCALRQVNNNPEYFPGVRLIVEFAVTSSFATNQRRVKQEKRRQARLQRVQNKEKKHHFQFDEPDENPDSDVSDEIPTLD